MMRRVLSAAVVRRTQHHHTSVNGRMSASAGTMSFSSLASSPSQPPSSPLPMVCSRRKHRGRAFAPPLSPTARRTIVSTRATAASATAHDDDFRVGVGVGFGSAGIPEPPTVENDGSKYGGIDRQADFFEEPVTFLGTEGMRSSSPSKATDVPSAMEAFDAFNLAVVSRGGSCDGGGDEEGIAAQAAHSSAIAWAKLLRHASYWNPTPEVVGPVDGAGSGVASGGAKGENESSHPQSAPMLAVVAVAPVLAQAGIGYARRVDALLAEADGVRVQLVALADSAASRRDDPCLPPRERWHLHALYHLLRDGHRAAMGAYLRLLEVSPGDALALSLALDVACALGDKNAALRAAGSVASYWNERGYQGMGLRPSIPGHSIGQSLIALGFSCGGRFRDAERLAEEALSRDMEGCGGVAAWALAHAYEAEGRASEGISKLAGYDGVQHYERCGLIFFDSRMGGYGARFLLDRDGAGAGRSATRMYDQNFERVFQYNGFLQGKQRGRMNLRRAPGNRKRNMVNRAAKSLFGGLFGSGNQRKEAEGEEDAETSRINDQDQAHSKKRNIAGSVARSMEDILCWLPATPQLLSDATMVLLRLTLSGAVSERDQRWTHLRHAWENLVSTEGKLCQPLESLPIAWVASSLLVEPGTINNTLDSDLKVPIAHVMKGLRIMGKLMNLGGEESIEKRNNEDTIDTRNAEDWKDVVNHLADAREGGFRWKNTDTAVMESIVSLGAASPCTEMVFRGWDMDTRPILDSAICHAACLSNDFQSLCLARAICSEGTALRRNCPEIWWRYSLVLDALGDSVAAENARAASVSLGAGEGGAGLH